jgi:hypothetical protein
VVRNTLVVRNLAGDIVGDIVGGIVAGHSNLAMDLLI